MAKRTSIKGLRLKFYSNETADNGEVVSGVADQYGRLMVQYRNKGSWDIKPSGLAIHVNH